MQDQIKSKAELKALIANLEQTQSKEWPLLKVEANLLFESFKPANIVTDIIIELTKNPEVKHNLLNTALGMGAGYVSKRLVQGGSPGGVMRIFGSLVEMSVSGVVAQNSDGLSEVIIQRVAKWFARKPSKVP